MRGELIGKRLEVAVSANSNLTGAAGKIVNETKNTFTIQNHKERIVPKKGNTFRINGQEVQGDDLLARPEDRIKK